MCRVILLSSSGGEAYRSTHGCMPQKLEASGSASPVVQTEGRKCEIVGSSLPFADRHQARDSKLVQSATRGQGDVFEGQPESPEG